MALSEREQQVLRDLEEQLHVEDPSLAHTMDSAEVPAGRVSPRHVGAGAALVLVGLALVITGVAVGHSVASIFLGVAGFGLAVWGVTLSCSPGPIPPAPGARGAKGLPAGAPPDRRSWAASPSAGTGAAAARTDLRPGWAPTRS